MYIDNNWYSHKKIFQIIVSKRKTMFCPFSMVGIPLFQIQKNHL